MHDALQRETGDGMRAPRCHTATRAPARVQCSVTTGSSSSSGVLARSSSHVLVRCRYVTLRYVAVRQVKADSDPLMVCRSALAVVNQPPDCWYKDEGGKNNCIDICVQVRVWCAFWKTRIMRSIVILSYCCSTVVQEN